MIAIVPTGGKNLSSVVGACRRLGVRIAVTEDATEIRDADRVILPGVGYAETMMARLRAKNLPDVLRCLAQPVLGICLGMQLLFDASEEAASGSTDLLRILPGNVHAIPDRGRALPHIGWNRVFPVPAHEAADRLAASVAGRYVYFVHGYMVPDGPWTTAFTDHGTPIPAVVRWRNFAGAQFHPERSGDAGMDFLKEFVSL